MENFETKAQKLKSDVHNYLESWFAMHNIDEWVVKLLRANATLSGSSISSIYHGENVNDFDFYFNDRRVIESVVEVFKHDLKLQEQIVTWNAYEDNTDIPVIDGKSFTNRAITLKNKIQLIVMGTLDEVRPTFDMIHCMPCYDLTNNVFRISEKQMHAIENKLIVKNPARVSPVTDKRIQKFLDRGWKLSVVPTTDLTKTLDLV